jgi:hypothetical protein
MLKLAQNGVCGAGDFTRGINIFDTYSPDTLLRARLQVATQCSNQRAKMEFTGR